MAKASTKFPFFNVSPEVKDAAAKGVAAYTVGSALHGGIIIRSLCRDGEAEVLQRYFYPSKDGPIVGYKCCTLKSASDAVKHIATVHARNALRVGKVGVFITGGAAVCHWGYPIIRQALDTVFPDSGADNEAHNVANLAGQSYNRNAQQR